jgi:hypothetical protein
MRVICLTLPLVTVMFLSGGAEAQYRQRRPGSGSSIAGAYDMPAATLHGTLKKITGKDIILLVENDQSVTIDRTHKTKFLRDGKEVKPADIALGSVVTVDVTQDPQLKPQAVNLTVESGPIDREPLPTSGTSMATGSTETGPADSGSQAKATPAKPAAGPNQ